jgi:hypothetical protein
MIFIQNVNFISHFESIFYHMGEYGIKALSYEKQSEIKFTRYMILQPKDWHYVGGIC